MLCKSCGCEMRIASSGTRVTGDSSPDTPTYVYSVQTLRCMNRSCPHPDEAVVEHRIYPAEPEPTPEPAPDDERF